MCSTWAETVPVLATLSIATERTPMVIRAFRLVNTA
ncbi:hypothetical protein EVA_07082 [gut metagenome]|uniref:Uncharacterized protein n=1 Tax=gut metagenome TaxID=749906 RepID=J9GD59_9ZZZZ